MAAPPLSFTELTVAGQRVHVFDMPDRRPTSGSSQPTRWVFQMELEGLLYGNATEHQAVSTGAMYRLLQRTPGAKGRALCLRHKNTAISEGLVSEVEWQALLNCLHAGVRSITLVPVDTVIDACGVYGETAESRALVEALGSERPTEWDAEEDSEDDDHEGGGDDEHDSGSDTGGGEHFDDGEVSIAATEEWTNPKAGEYSDSGADEPTDSAAGAQHEAGAELGERASVTKKARIQYTLTEVPDQLQRDLDVFLEWRCKPINQNRDGVSVEQITAAGNKADGLRLLGWLQSRYNIAPSLGGVFGSERLGGAVQRFVDHLRACGRTYTTIGGYLKSFIALSRFAHKVKQARATTGVLVSSAPVDAMRRAHEQAMQQARIEQRFATSSKPTAHLTWAQVQTARARAVRLYEAGGGSEREQNVRLWDAVLLSWLTSVPPDRVGVTRLLQLGVTLKPNDARFDLDLSTPNAHKTAAVFGPTVTPVPDEVCTLLNTWVAAAKLDILKKPYVFLLTGNHDKPATHSNWTKMVQASFKRQSGVALAPKDLRRRAGRAAACGRRVGGVPMHGGVGTVRTHGRHTAHAHTQPKWAPARHPRPRSASSPRRRHSVTQPCPTTAHAQRVCHLSALGRALGRGAEVRCLCDAALEQDAGQRRVRQGARRAAQQGGREGGDGLRGKVLSAPVRGGGMNVCMHMHTRA